MVALTGGFGSIGRLVFYAVTPEKTWPVEIQFASNALAYVCGSLRHCAHQVKVSGKWLKQGLFLVEKLVVE